MDDIPFKKKTYLSWFPHQLWKNWPLRIYSAPIYAMFAISSINSSSDIMTNLIKQIIWGIDAGENTSKKIIEREI